jgi:hypothetical protein
MVRLTASVPPHSVAAWLGWARGLNSGEGFTMSAVHNDLASY